MASKVKQIPIEDATREQLFAFVDTVGLEYKGRPGEDALRELIISAGYAGNGTIPEIKVSNPTVTFPKSARRQIVWNRHGKACFAIVIPTSDQPGGDKAVPVGVNGEHRLIPRGKPVPVMIEEVFGSLEDGVQSVAEVDRDGNVIRWVNVFAYPFQYVDPDLLEPKDLAPEDFEPTEELVNRANKMIADREVYEERMRRLREEKNRAQG